MNRRIIEPEATKPNRTYLIRWPDLQRQFEAAFSNYVEFARDVLRMPLPLSVFGGLALVQDALFTPTRTEWFHNTPRSTRCMKNFISSAFEIRQWSEANVSLLQSLFSEILDECNQTDLHNEGHPAKG